MNSKNYLLTLMGVASVGVAAAQQRPNIVIIMADDLGYGSLNCYGSDRDLVRTPNIDRLAAQGVRYLNAYSTASVSSPTRYSMLTGEYPFRSGRTSGVVNPFDPLQINHERPTIADLVKDEGYNTATIGKWHHGYGDLKQVDKTYKAYTGKLTPGPLDLGFDYHFGTPQNHDDLWGVYIENDGIWGLKSDKISGYSRSYYGEQYVGFDAPRMVLSPSKHTSPYTHCVRVSRSWPAITVL
ncbi:MAG: sulfatase-like hydrolase/transferase [Rikenellaceae bacterium]